jgi:limonene-1,2-epoxide hydrolase
VVRAELAAWARLDADEIMGYFAPDAVWENVPIGVASGPDEIRASVLGFLGPTTFFGTEILNLAVTGNVVLTERVDDLTMDGTTIHARIFGGLRG